MRPFLVLVLLALSHPVIAQPVYERADQLELLPTPRERELLSEEWDVSEMRRLAESGREADAARLAQQMRKAMPELAEKAGDIRSRSDSAWSRLRPRRTFAPPYKGQFQEDLDSFSPADFQRVFTSAAQGARGNNASKNHGRDAGVQSPGHSSAGLGDSVSAGSSRTTDPARSGRRPLDAIATDYVVTPGLVAATLSKLKPGDRMILQDGTYAPLSISDLHGTPSAPITVMAENERKALIKSDGTRNAVDVINSSHIVLFGLHIENSDNPENTRSNGRALVVGSSHQITIQRNLLARPNRYGNNAALALSSGSNHCLVEENEVYWFHRNGVTVHGYDSHSNTFRRNYVNGRGVVDLSGTGPNDALVMYQGRDNVIEKNISEYPDREGLGFGSWGVRNRFYGNIAYRTNGGFSSITATTSGFGDDNVYVDNVAWLSSRGFGLNTVSGTIMENNTVVGTTGGGLYARTKRIAKRPDDWNASFAVRNTLMADIGGRSAYVVDDTENFDSRVIEYSSGWKNASGTWGAGTENRTHTLPDQNPRFGETVIYIPRDSPYKGAGRNGADVGANVLYRYVGGELTGEPLWDPSTGEFPHGAIVPGVNDITGSSAFDVHTRLNVSPSTLPPDY